MEQAIALPLNEERIFPRAKRFGPSCRCNHLWGHDLFPAPFPLPHRQIQGVPYQLQLLIDRGGCGSFCAPLGSIGDETLRSDLRQNLFPEHWHQVLEGRTITHGTFRGLHTRTFGEVSFHHVPKRVVVLFTIVEKRTFDDLCGHLRENCCRQPFALADLMRLLLAEGADRSVGVWQSRSHRSMAAGSNRRTPLILRVGILP